MDQVRSPSAGQDIDGLRRVIRRHLQDREAIRAGRVQLIHFVDAHELKAYIHGVSDDYLEGFELGPERQLRASKDDPDLLPQLRLKCDLAIRWLLFGQPHPVIVLPSHGVEIEEEIAFQRQRELVRDLGMLEEAKAQLRQLREAQFANALISEMASRALQGDTRSKERLAAFVERAAPALGVVLNIVSAKADTIPSRISELLRRSRLTTLGRVAWASYGLTAPQIEMVRRVGLEERRVSKWQLRLEARRPNSERSNRLDAEAIAYVESLNAVLASARIAVRGVLATHTGTLVHAARGTQHEEDELLGESDPIRHVRLLAWDSVDAASAASLLAAPEYTKTSDPLGDAVAQLEQVLSVYNGKLILRAPEAPGFEKSEAHALMDAWTAFETARATLGLASKDESTRSSAPDDSLGRGGIERLLEWLRSEQELESLIADRLSRLVATFGREMLTPQGIQPLQVNVRATRIGERSRTQIVPIGPRLIGPIFMEGKSLDKAAGPRRMVFPPDSGIELSDGTPRAYLVLTLLQASRENLPLAEVYARAATDAADFARDDASAAQARLLSAQIYRTTSGNAKGGGRRTPDEIRRHLDDAQRLLNDAQRYNPTPEIRVERAALLLERLLNHLDSDEAVRRIFAQGVDDLESVFSRIPEDDRIMRMRAAELLLAYAISDATISRDYGTGGAVPPRFVERWHEILTTEIGRLRAEEDYLLEELPLLTRAIEVIGYAMIHDARVKAGEKLAVSGDCGIPNNLSLDIHSVQRGLSACADRVSQQMARVLADVNARSGSNWSYSFVHAPVWERSDVEKAICDVEDADLRYAIQSANQLLHRVGDDQRILMGESGQLELLREAKRRYSELLQRLDSDTSRPVRFLVQMEHCYAGLLESAQISDRTEKQNCLRELSSRYEAMLAEFGPHPTLLYRQSIVFGELELHDKALAAVQQAQNCWNDEHQFLVGASWMRSTIRRRIGLHFSREAKGQLAQLKLGGASPEAHERCRETLRMAFRSTFEGFETDPVERSLRGKAEMLRRLNNIVFYASLFLQAEGRIGDLHPDFNNEMFGLFLARLKAESAVIEREWFYAHTIGSAHHVRRERVEANAAADALLTLLAASGASTQTEAIRLAIDDAFSWKRAAAGETRP